MPNPSPGHRQMPEHKVAEHKVAQRMTVTVGDQRVAESADVIRVDEDRMPPRFYFPRADVRMNLLRASAKTTECPFKGQASYFSLDLGGGKDQLPDAAWSYDSPSTNTAIWRAGWPFTTTRTRRSAFSRLAEPPLGQAGLMFWFTRNRFCGSYLALIEASRA
jgi:uncharacterized protein (DUF427 family)